MPQGTAGSLTLTTIRQRILKQPPETRNADYERLRPASVLVPLVWFENRWHLLYTRRTETLASHKGQVAFPGGAADPLDRTPEETALREAHEEIGLRPGDVEVLGRLNRRPTISQFYVSPVVSVVPWPYEFVLSLSEVGRVFIVPLDWLAQASNREIRPYLGTGGFYKDVIYYLPYDGEVVWGATARITLDLLEILGLA